MPPEPSFDSRKRPARSEAGQWHYGIRPTPRGEWTVERDGGVAGGIFATLTEAVRFLRYDLDALVLSQDPVEHGT